MEGRKGDACLGAVREKDDGSEDHGVVVIQRMDGKSSNATSMGIQMDADVSTVSAYVQWCRMSNGKRRERQTATRAVDMGAGVERGGREAREGRGAVLHWRDSGVTDAVCVYRTEGGGGEQQL